MTSLVHTTLSAEKSMKSWRCCFLVFVRVGATERFSSLQIHALTARLQIFGPFPVSPEYCQGGAPKRQTSDAGPAAAGLAVRNQATQRRFAMSSWKKQCLQCCKKDTKTDDGRCPATVFGFCLCNTHLCN